jgi:hypothetical protein
MIIRLGPRAHYKTFAQSTVVAAHRLESSRTRDSRIAGLSLGVAALSGHLGWPGGIRVMSRSTSNGGHRGMA